MGVHNSCVPRSFYNAVPISDWRLELVLRASMKFRHGKTFSVADPLENPPIIIIGLIILICFLWFILDQVWNWLRFETSYRSFDVTGIGLYGVVMIIKWYKWTNSFGSTNRCNYKGWALKTFPNCIQWNCILTVVNKWRYGVKLICESKWCSSRLR